MSTPTPTPGGAPASDPPPYAWLDDPAQPFGPVGIGTTVVVGSVLGAIGLFGLAYGLFGGDDARGARLGVGIAFGDDSRVGRFGRWLLVAVCAFVTLVMVLALRRAATGETPTSAGAVVVIVLLGLFAAVIGVMAAMRTRAPKR